ncbi:MAG: transposase [Magnetococcus sp. DMHC-6]
MADHKLPTHFLKALDMVLRFENKESWEVFLQQKGIKGPRHKRIATEGVLMGGLLASGFSKDMSILSDDAGQFNVFDHALCWIHAERGITKLNPINEDRKKAVKWARTQIWDLYADLKLYKLKPDQNKALAKDIHDRFDELCMTTTCYPDLNETLKRLLRNKDELLRVLDKPWLPLHNNLSESDIREYVQKRKISGGTRSESGRRCRDTFASLKKTCRKHGITFWEFLKDRVGNLNQIPFLPEVIRNASHAS